MSEQVIAEETQEVSAEDRAASIFGDEQPEANEAAPQEAQAEATAEETFEFEDGERKYVLPKALEGALQRQKDYTQKTQSLAEMRKDVDRQMAQIKLAQSEAAFNASVKAEADQMAMIDAVLAEYNKLKWAEMQTDELVRKKLEMDQYRDMRNGIDAQIKAKRAEFDGVYQKELARLKEESAKSLNWNEETEKEVRAYARDVGLTDAEYESVFDPRHKRILWEASQYRKNKAGAQAAVQQVKAVKTGSVNQMPQAVKDKLAFRKAVDKAKTPTEKRHLAEARAAKIFG